VRKEDIQILYGFSNNQKAKSYLRSKMFVNNIMNELEPLLISAPEIRLYEASHNPALHFI